MKIIIRKALEKDYKKIVSLQEKIIIFSKKNNDNQLANLLIYSEEDFKHINNDGLVLIAEENGFIVGYICASGEKFNHHCEIVKETYQKMVQHTYNYKPLSDYKSLKIGPIAIEPEKWGYGLVPQLVTAIFKLLPNNIELLISSIHKANYRSLKSAKKNGWITLPPPSSDFDRLVLIKELSGKTES